MDRNAIVGVHLLGAADIGCAPRDFPDTLSRLLQANFEERYELLQSTRSEGQHRALAPLASLLYHAEAVSHVWIVATDQDPPEPGDTVPLARILIETIERDPTFFGRSVTAEIVTVHTFGLSAFSDAISDRIHTSDPGIEGVVLGIGGGPVEGHLGLMLGCVASGVLPQICDTNRQDAEGTTFELLMRTDVQRWLVRTAAFDTLAAIDRARSAEWRLLGALRRLDWRAARAAFAELEPESPRTLAGLKPPSSVCGTELESTGPRDWTWYRSVLESVLRRRVGFGEVSGLHLARPWVCARMRELFAGLQRSHPGVATELQQRVREATKYGDGFDFDVLLQMDPNTLGNSNLEKFAGDKALRKLWTSGARLDHGWRPTFETALRVVSAAHSDTDPLAEALASLGHPLWPLLPSKGRIVIKCVGLQDLTGDGDTPMLDALVRGLESDKVPLSESHLRLLASPDTHNTSDILVEAAQRCGFGTAVTVPTPQPVDYRATLDSLLPALEQDERLEAVREVWIAINAGTKAMNLAAVAAGLQWSYDRGKAIRVAPLRRVGGGAATSLIVLDTEPAASVAPRLAHDAAAGSVLPLALLDLDFGLARTVVATASNTWSGFGEMIDLLEWLARERGDLALPPEGVGIHTLHQLGRRRALSRPGALWRAGWNKAPGPALWPARLRLHSELATRDPWKAIYQVAAIAERCWPGRDWRRPRFSACHRIWIWRNESPLGHDVWRCPPASRDIAATFNEAAIELRKAGLVPQTEVPVDEKCLMVLRQSMIDYANHLATKRLVRTQGAFLDAGKSDIAVEAGRTRYNGH